MGRERKTHEEFCEEVYELVGDEYEVIGEYTNARTKIKIKHNKCSNYINPIPDDFLNGKRCKFCQHRSFKKTTEEFQNEIDEVIYNRYKVIEEYKNGKTEIKIKDTMSKEIINLKPNSFLENIKRNNGIYSKSITYTTETFKKELNKINPNIDVLGEYIKSNIPILCRCIIDNHEWSPFPSSLLSGSGCPKCANVYKRTHEEFIEEIKLINENIIVIGTFTTIKNNILVKCLKCTGEWEPSAESLLSGYGCPYCSNQKILKGYNDMWTTNPELAKLLADPEDGYKYFQGSNKKVNFKCPDCNSIIKNKSIANIKNHGLSCNSCSDGISYPNKIMYNLLNQLIDFIPEYCPKWLKSKRYDFYFIKDNNEYIVEMDGGLGHGNYNTLSKMTAEESIALDKYKEDLAIQHNIEVVRIDCLKSELDYIKSNILNSKLNVLFDLNKIDWLECHKLSLNSFVKTACELWNTSEYSVKDIGKLLKLTPSTIVRYLKKGNLIYWCKYNSEDEKIKNVKNNAILNSKKIRCIETGIIYNSMNEASKYVNRSPKTMSACCRGRINTCGVSDDGVPLHWECV